MVLGDPGLLLWGIKCLILVNWSMKISAELCWCWVCIQDFNWVSFSITWPPLSSLFHAPNIYNVNETMGRNSISPHHHPSSWGEPLHEELPFYVDTTKHQLFQSQQANIHLASPFRQPSLFSKFDLDNFHNAQ